MYLPNTTCTSWVRKHGLDKDFTQRAAMNLTFDLKFDSQSLHIPYTQAVFRWSMSLSAWANGRVGENVTLTWNFKRGLLRL